MILRPSHPAGGVVIYTHGYGSDATAIVEREGPRRLAAGLVNAGYVVASSDAHGDAWSNDASIASYLALADHLSGEAASLFVIAQSMGGRAGLHLTAALPIAAWVGIFPLFDLLSIAPRWHDSIAAAHSGAVPTGPPPASVRGLPMLVYASYADLVVERAANADALACWAREAGASADVVDAGGNHGDPSAFRPMEVVAFFDAARAPRNSVATRSRSTPSGWPRGSCGSSC